MSVSARSGIIVTDLASSENYLTKTAMVGGPPVNINRKFAHGAKGFVALAPIPPRFASADLANGIIGYYAPLDSSSSHQLSPGQAVRLVAHGPGPVRSHSSGWRALGGPILGPGGRAQQEPPNVALAAQRHGDTVVGIVNVPTLAEKLVATVIKSAGDIQTKVIDIAPDMASPFTANRLFISDSDDPFVWSYEGAPNQFFCEVTGCRLSDLVGDTMGTKFVHYVATNNHSDGQTHRTGASGAFSCWLNWPEASMASPPIDPCFVKPWATDAMPAPELWFFVPEYNGGARTGRWEIYRSRWLAGQRRRGHYEHPSGYYGFSEYLDDDNAFNAGTNTFPRRNHYGFAFESDWYNHAHKVGVTGPFPSTEYGGGGGGGGGSNMLHAQGRMGLVTDVMGPQFRIERDRKRYGVLHLVYANFVPDGGDYYGGLNATDVWYSTSRNDGATWSQPILGLRQTVLIGT